MKYPMAFRPRLLVVLAGLATLSACVTAPAQDPKTAPTPTVAVKVIPPRPQTPGGAPQNMVTPAVGADGIRRTVNYGISTSQQIWNLRSALSVASLNCRDPKYTGIVAAYGKMLKQNKLTLAAVYRRVLDEHKEEHGSNQLPAFDAYMTNVYNYFSSPHAKREFCEVADQIATESLPIEGRTAMEQFAGPALARVERVFHDFYTRYDQYRVAVNAWDAQYGTPASSSYGGTTTVITHAPYTTTSTSVPSASVPSASVPSASVPSSASAETVTSAMPKPITTVDSMPPSSTAVTVPASNTASTVPPANTTIITEPKKPSIIGPILTKPLGPNSNTTPSTSPSALPSTSPSTLPSAAPNSGPASGTQQPDTEPTSTPNGITSDFLTTPQAKPASAGDSSGKSEGDSGK